MIFQIFFKFLCSVSRVLAEYVLQRCDRCVSVPAELSAKTATLNHD